MKEMTKTMIKKMNLRRKIKLVDIRANTFPHSYFKPVKRHQTTFPIANITFYNVLLHFTMYFTNK